MILNNILRSQFGQPNGLLGTVFMAPLLNAVNMRLVDRTIDLLAPQPKDRLLDIGFGGGHSLLRLAERAPQGSILGVDYSPEMVEGAARLIRDGFLEKRVKVRCGDVSRLPFRPRTFDRVLTVNSVYYWPDVTAGFREIARVLKPGGRVAVGCRSRASLSPFTFLWDDFRLYTPGELAAIVETAGFKVCQVEYSDRWRIPDMVVVVGERVTRPGVGASPGSAAYAFGAASSGPLTPKFAGATPRLPLRK